MATSRWHKLYSSKVAAPPAALFALLSDLPNYARWLPASVHFAQTADVEPYPVQLGSRYHDGKPGEPGKNWWGTVTGFQPPGSLDFHHTIQVSQLKATVDVHIHYSLEPDDSGTHVTRWLVLDIAMPMLLRPARRLIIRSSTKRTCGPWRRSRSTPRLIATSSRPNSRRAKAPGPPPAGARTPPRAGRGTPRAPRAGSASGRRRMARASTRVPRRCPRP